MPRVVHSILLAILLTVALIPAAHAGGSCQCTWRSTDSVTSAQRTCFANPKEATATWCRVQFESVKNSIPGTIDMSSVRCEPYLSADCGTGTAGAVAEPAPEFRPVPPDISFAIPGFKFSDILVRDLGGGVRSISIPWIGEYLAAIYKFAVPIGAMLATVVIMVAGLVWISSAGGGQKETALGWIRNAVIGLLLLVGSYVILNLINPDLVRFTQLEVRFVEPEELVEESEPDSVSGFEPTGIVRASGANIIGRAPVSAALLTDLQLAATALATQNIQLSLTSGYRGEGSQRELIARNCQNPPGSPTCSPKPGRPMTCILREGLKSCPHTTGRAVDVWGAKNGRQCVRQKDCLKNKTACRADACQAAVIAAMRAQGFCNLGSEPWHFEKPKMSTNCS